MAGRLRVCVVRLSVRRVMIRWMMFPKIVSIKRSRRRGPSALTSDLVARVCVCV